ncbi:ribokinase [Frisingicoccus sp.]|uniref:ribokinase n=1 Tax=Frisingicoccus sp. TaxID=1918627 RepID=UPI003AB1A308
MRILCLGSLNMDYIYQVSHIVQPGETLTSEKLDVLSGGKGLNQAIAMGRTGMNVCLAGRIGADGQWLLDGLETYGVDASRVQTVDVSTGKAMIQVAADGQNCILLYPGANRQMTEAFIDGVLDEFGEGDMLVLQNEVNLLDYMIDRAYEKKMRIILNPSPFDAHIEKCALEKVSYFFVNETEGQQMTGESAPEAILDTMAERYPESGVILTLGGDGSWYSDRSCRVFQDIVKTEVVDTTGAGDTFSGYFIQGIASGRDIKETMETAALAASITVSRVGAAHAIPSMDEVAAMRKKKGFEK